MKQSDQDEVLRELRRISRLLVLLATKGQIQKEKIAALSSVGFQVKEIADLVGTTPNTVSVALAHIRKRAKADKAAPRSSSRGRTSHDEQEPS